nr:hypothetical protein [Tanacetum cinerariifolium]
NVEGIVDITEFFRKLKFICHWADPFKDLNWSNVPGVKLSSLSKSDDTFSSLQALSDLYYLFSGFMYYLWSRELNIFNVSPANRKLLPVVPSRRTSNALCIPHKFSASMFSSSIAPVWASRIYDVMLRLELHIFFALVVGKLTLGFLPRRCLILNYFNLGEVNMNSLTINHVPKKLHGANLEITFEELGYNYSFLSNSKIILRLSFDDSLISSQFLSKHLNLEAGQINHRSGVMANDSSWTGAPQGKVLGRIKPLSANSFSWFDSSCISDEANLHDKLLSLVADCFQWLSFCSYSS